jgi:hypothetical protein
MNPRTDFPRQINEWEADAKKIVSHMHDVRVGKINDTVAVGMAIMKMPYLDIFAIEMDRDIVVKSQDR